MLGLALAVVVTLIVGFVAWKSAGSRGGDSDLTADGGVDRTVGVLREKDPVCDEWGKYADELAEKEKRWAELTGDTIPAAQWTAEQRKGFVDKGVAMVDATNQLVALLRKARSPVLQELIAQSIIYLRAYVRGIPSYVARDALLAGVASNFTNAVTFMCRSVQLLPAARESYFGWTSTVRNPGMLSDFMEERDVVCAEFVALLDRQSSMLQGWTAGDPLVTADQWSDEERALNAGAGEVLSTDLAQLYGIAERANGRVVGDLIATHNSYLKAFVDVIPTYNPSDIQLWRVVIAIAGGITAACEARP